MTVCPSADYLSRLKILLAFRIKLKISFWKNDFFSFLFLVKFFFASCTCTMSIFILGMMINRQVNTSLLCTSRNGDGREEINWTQTIQISRNSKSKRAIVILVIFSSRSSNSDRASSGRSWSKTEIDESLYPPVLVALQRGCAVQLNA